MRGEYVAQRLSGPMRALDGDAESYWGMEAWLDGEHCEGLPRCRGRAGMYPTGSGMKHQPGV
jgi:hypothetical protein